jgi:integrase
VPLPPEGVELVKRCLPWQMTNDELRYGLERARELAGMPHVRLHDLRHTYASWLLNERAPLAVVRDLLGHASISTTNVYVHSNIDHARRAVKKARVGVGSQLGQGTFPKRRRRAVVPS